MKPRSPVLQNIYTEITQNKKSICIDSKILQVGDIFFGIKGERVDGGSFAKNVLKLKASLVVINESLRKNLSSKITSNPRVVFVENTIKTLHSLAKYHRDQFDIPIIGVTGSNGKTTTKNMIAAVLSSGFKNVFATGKNHNSKVGLPIEILKMNLANKHDIAVFEMGASEAGDIANLCTFANPTHSIVTTIGRAHIKDFGSIEEIIRTKMAIHEWVFKNNGHAFAHTDNELVLNETLKRTSSKDLVTTYSHSGNPTADVFPLLKTEGFKTKYTFTKESSTKDFVLASAPGENMKISIAAAICIAKHFKMTEDQIANGLLSYQHDPLRGSLWQTSGGSKITWFADAYNANPESMIMALDTLAAAVTNTKNRGALLGDMLELGPNSVQWHQEVLEKTLTVTNKIVLCGPDFLAAAQNTKLPKNALLFKNTDHLLKNKHHVLSFFDTKIVLAKSSNGTDIKRVIKEIAERL